MKWFPTDRERFITTGIIAATLGFLVGIFVGKKTADLDFIVTSLTTLFAAYIGAKLAFQLQVKRQQQDEVKNHVTAGNKAIFELIRTYNKFIAVRNQFINPLRDNPLRHYFIPPISGTDTHLTSFNYDSLAFFINTKDPDVLNKLSLFEQEANSTVEVINQRSELHYNYIQTAVEKAEKTHGSKITKEQIDATVGRRIQTTIETSTNIMVECVDSVIKKAPEYIDHLRDLLKDEYKGHIILGMKIPNKSKSTEKSN